MSGETAKNESPWTVDSLHEHLREVLDAYRRESAASIAALKELTEAHREGDTLAVDKAFDAANKLTEAHNGLLRKIELLSETFATKEAVDAAFDSAGEAADKRFVRLESWQAKVTGGLLVVAAVGLANFVKLWTG